MHGSPRTPCRNQPHVRIYASTTSTAFTLAPCWHHASHQQPSLLLICFCYQQLQTNPPSTPPFFCPLILTQPPTYFTACCWSFSLGFAFSSLDVHCRNKKKTGHKGAWHFRLEEAQKLSSHACPISIKKRAQLGTASQQMT